MLGEVRDDALGRVRGGEQRVVVEVDVHLTGGLACAEAERAARAELPGWAQVADGRKARGDQVFRVVGGGIVDHQDLAVGVVLRLDTLEATREGVAAVSGGDDEGEPRHRHVDYYTL